MGLIDSVGRKPPHAPVNPATGMPNGEPGWPAPAPCESAPDAFGANAREAEAPGTEAPGTEAPDAGDPSAAFADAGGAGRMSNYSATESFFVRLRQVIDSRVLSVITLTILLFVLVGVSHILAFLSLLFAGYVLIDRFVQVRRCIVIGGATWLLVMLAGFVLDQSLGAPLVFGIDHFFTFCGFLLALAVCGAFFAGRYMYHVGFRHGQDRADHVIARHMISRLIDHPNDWSGLDGDYLEVESALNRVRERERMAEQALRDEAGRKDDLVTYLAHDLKTPLASVVGYLSLLHEAPDLPLEQRARFCGIALEKAHRLDALIEEFFDITRFDFHDIVLTRGYVDLNLMLAQVADEFYPTLAEQGKSARIDVPEGLTVLIDGDKMARVFNNVMKNAIAYSYENSTIDVSARRREDLAGAPVEILFENQGDPIPAPKLKVIFEKFYRLDAARTTNRGGAGLGLAIAKEIVAAHGGTISCTSSPEKTVFSILLPTGA